MSELLRDLFDDHLDLPLPWPSALALAVVVVLALELFNRQAFRALERVARRTETALDDALVRRMRWPAQALVLVVALHVLFILRGGHSATGSQAVTIVELGLVAYLGIESVETLVLHYWLGERKKLKLPNVVRHLLLVIVYAVTALSIVGAVTGVNLVPLLATSTVITVVLGLALQDTLGNLFAGLALSLEKPFREGDHILVDGVEGRVEHIGWRATHVRTFTRDLVVFPNSILGKARLQNFDRPAKETGRNVEVLVALAARPADVEAALAAAVARVPALLAEPASKAWLVATTPLYHRYVMRVWVGDFATHDDAESDFMKALSGELDARGIALAPARVAVDAEGRAVMAAR